MVNFWFKKVSMKTMLATVALLSSKYANRYDYECTYDEDKREYTLVLTHGAGRRWTIYLQQLFKNAFRLTGIEIDTEVMENQLVFRVNVLPETSDS